MKRNSIISFGEVLWDLLPDASLLGGAPFNFTYRINSLGNTGIIVTAIGNDELGEKALKAISNLGINTDYIQVNPIYSTGTVNVFFDASKNPNYEIIKDVAYDYINFELISQNIIKDADCICFGTLAQRNDVSRRTLSRLLKLFKGRFRFYDLNLRKECYSVEIIVSSLKNADILKLNENEAIELNKLLGLKQTNIVKISKELIKLYQLQYCVVTLEERGSLCLSNKGQVVYTPGYKIQIEDPLGAGDAFSAAFVNAVLQGKTLEEAAETGNQYGALVASKKGATQKITQDELKKLVLGNIRIIDHSYNNYTSNFLLTKND